jgi:hypothetical protein
MSDNKNNTGNWNTGDHNTGNWNTGHLNSGKCNSGDRNTGDWNTGDWNTGVCNSGDRNSGNRNSGNRNTGDWNTGNWNTGDRNTGYWNTGDWNTGNWNTIDRSTGYFNTVQEHIVMVFNKPMLSSDFHKLDLPSFLFFYLVEFVQSSEMTDEEKEENPSYETTGGYLKKLYYKEAFQKSYNDLSEEERVEQTKQLKALPNFDADVFYEISGIRIESSDSIQDKISELKSQIAKLESRL